MGSKGHFQSSTDVTLLLFRAKSLTDISMARHLGVEATTDITTPNSKKKSATTSAHGTRPWSLAKRIKNRSDAAEEEDMELHFAILVYLNDDAPTKVVIDPYQSPTPQ